MRTVIVDVALHSPGNTQPDRDAVIYDGRDERGGNALVLSLDGGAEDDGRGREAHVHAPGRDNQRGEELRPVGLMDGRGRKEDGGDAEGAQRACHDHVGAEPGQQEGGRTGGARARDGGRDELRGSEEGFLPTQLGEELPRVVHPDAEGSPACNDACQHEERRGVEHFVWDERLRRAFLDQQEGGHEDEANDQEDVDVGGLPADVGALVPRDVDANEASDAGQSAGEVEGLFRASSCGRRGDNKEGEDGIEKALKEN